jgi:hypothetical protein
MALVDDIACEGATQSRKRIERAGYPLPVIPSSRSREMVEESHLADDALTSARRGWIYLSKILTSQLKGFYSA